MKIFTRTFLAALAIAMTAAGTMTAEAKIYNIVIGGKATPFDCPESPQGHTLTWVNQNCEQQRVQKMPKHAPARTARKN